MIKRLVVIAAVVAIALSGCAITAATPKPKPSYFDASGTLVFHYSKAKNPCFSAPITNSGYSDLVKGAQVVITNDSGKTVGVGQLDDYTWPGGWGSCTFTWSVPHVRAGSEFYGVQVTHRGIVQAKMVDLRDGNAALTIGG